MDEHVKPAISAIARDSGEATIDQQAEAKLCDEEADAGDQADAKVPAVAAAAASPPPHGMDPIKALSFPAKLHAMLSRADIADIVSWMPHGRSWRVHQPKMFELHVIPEFFVHCKYSSFIRQANGWGFRRIPQGPDRNSYYHEYFLRGRLQLCQHMRRSAARGRPPLDPEDPPDFYRMSELDPLPAEGGSDPQGSYAIEIGKMTSDSSSAAAAGMTAVARRTMVRRMSSLSKQLKQKLQTPHGRREVGAEEGGGDEYNGRRVVLASQMHQPQVAQAAMASAAASVPASDTASAAVASRFANILAVEAAAARAQHVYGPSAGLLEPNLRLYAGAGAASPQDLLTASQSTSAPPRIDLGRGLVKLVDHHKSDAEKSVLAAAAKFPSLGGLHVDSSHNLPRQSLPSSIGISENTNRSFGGSQTIDSLSISRLLNERLASGLGSSSSAGTEGAVGPLASSIPSAAAGISRRPGELASAPVATTSSSGRGSLPASLASNLSGTDVDSLISHHRSEMEYHRAAAEALLNHKRGNKDEGGEGRQDGSGQLPHSLYKVP